MRDFSLVRADFGDIGGSNVKCLVPLLGAGAVFGSRSLPLLLDTLPVVAVSFEAGGADVPHLLLCCRRCEASSGVVDDGSMVRIDSDDS